MSSSNRHPFRSQARGEVPVGTYASPPPRRPPARSPRCRRATSADVVAPTRGVPILCVVQGDQCSPSAFYSMASMAAFMASRGYAVHVLTPDSVRAPCEVVLSMLTALPWTRFHSAADLRKAVSVLSPTAILLSSHDACFDALRRDPRTIRWTHEVPRCYDPQASRCSSPLFATGARACSHLPGFAGEACTFWDWSRQVGDARCEYTPGPVRVCGLGHTYDPRSNFKAFQVLVEKYATVQFTWVGASCNKHWHNLELLTPDADFADVLASSDVLVWCPDGDPCPTAVFQALYMGVRVQLYQKSFPFSLERLFSRVDGSALLDISSCAPQHAPLHVVAKNPKRPEDVQRTRAYVDELVSVPPELLVGALQEILGRAPNDEGGGTPSREGDEDGELDPP